VAAGECLGGSADRVPSRITTEGSRPAADPAVLSAHYYGRAAGDFYRLPRRHLLPPHRPLGVPHLVCRLQLASQGLWASNYYLLCCLFFYFVGLCKRCPFHAHLSLSVSLIGRDCGKQVYLGEFLSNRKELRLELRTTLASFYGI
jgi:hypothetical protein